MKRIGIVQGLAVCLAVMGICLPQALLAAPRPESSSLVLDVALHEGPEGAVLLGQVQDPQGAPQADVPVVLLSNSKKLGEGRTDKNGYFAFRNVERGVYQIAVGPNVGTYRAWTPGTAPPSAQQGALIVAGQDLLRGQGGWGGFKSFITHPLVIAGLVATAIAVPIAIHNADDGPSSP